MTVLHMRCIEDLELGHGSRETVRVAMVGIGGLTFTYEELNLT